MTNYFIDFDFPAQFEGVGKYAATSKARYDVTKIVMEITAVKRIVITRNYSNKCVGPIEVVLKLYKVLRDLPIGSSIFVQYPFVNLNAFKFISRFFNKYRVIALIHDLPSYRYTDKGIIEDEIRVLNSFSNIIVHSENMSKILKRDGLKSDVIVLGMFDYLLSENQSNVKESNAIVFAGALKKSKFLCGLQKLSLSMTFFNLYGRDLPEGAATERVRYKGVFNPNEIATISGEWGLLWEGNSIDTCSGNFGDYLKIIAPHKFSLYIACGLKIICWEQSAMADFVKKENIGFTINNLSEIEKKMALISDTEKRDMEKNIESISKKVRTGGFLKEALNKLNISK